MTRLLAISTVAVGLFGPTGLAHADSAEVKVGKADWEQGRPLWSLCEPRSKRAAAATPLKGQRQGPVAPVAETVPSWSDCEGIEGVERAMFDPVARTGGGMSGQLDDDDEPPICDGGTRCSPVPRSRSRVVSGITAAKAISPSPSRLQRLVDSNDVPPASIGKADDGYPTSLFEPPRLAA